MFADSARRWPPHLTPASAAGSQGTARLTGHTDTVRSASSRGASDARPDDQRRQMVGPRLRRYESRGAAFVVAAMRWRLPRQHAGVILTSRLARRRGSPRRQAPERDMKGEAGALVVAEPTSNRRSGPQGAVWLKAITQGVTAHGSMPEQGVNAVYSAARAVTKLETFDFNVARHPIMGGATLNVGSFAGGINVNSVPDRAEIGIDIRTLPGMDHVRLREQLTSYLGPDVSGHDCRRQGCVDGPDDPGCVSCLRSAQRIRAYHRKWPSAPYITTRACWTPDWAACDDPSSARAGASRPPNG